MQVTDCIWQYILTCWQIQNVALHSESGITHESRILTTQVVQIYKQIQAKPELQDLAPQQMPEQILQYPIKHIRNWATQSAQQVQTYVIAMHNKQFSICRTFTDSFLTKPEKDLEPDITYSDPFLYSCGSVELLW